MTQKLKLCLLLLLSWGLVACSHDLKGDGKIESNTRQLAAFEKIDVKGEYNVLVTSGKTQDVEVTADSNLLDAITTEVKDNTLYISSKRNFTASHTPVITLRVDKLKTLNTEGDIKAQVNNLVVDDFAITAAGATDVTLIGKVNSFEINSSGNSTVNSVGLFADKVKLHIAGSGNVSVNALEDLDVKIEGAAEVKYIGAPKITQDISGVGKLTKINSN